MEMIFFVNLLAAYIFMVPFMNCIESSCFTKCGTEASCLNSKLPIIRGLNLAATCNQESTCFGRSDATNIRIQQVSETLIEGQNLYLNVSNLLSNNFTFRVFNATNEDIFNSCNFENSTEIFYSYVNSSYLFEMPKLTIGTHYFIFDSSNNLFECNFGLRLQVFVYEDNCSIDNLLCSSNGQCAINKTAKSFNCLCCDSPYTGQYCSKYNYCHNHTCTNNATCVSDNNALNNTGYKCLCLMQFTGMFCENCVNGYIGKFCNTDINECQENATLCNYGNCTNFNESFSCQCFVNVTGKYCETDLYDNCVESKCSNVSTCIDKYGSYMCDCYPGYEGEFCDEEVDECIGNKCSVDGTEKCVDKFRGYSCQCHSGFTGELCDSITDACHPDPCQNGALCIAEIDSYKCICQAGFVGKNCSEVANKCLVLNPCENSGQCIRTGNNLRDYLCICPSGWTGKNCSTELKRCDSNPCLNNFTCIDSFDNFSCVCNSSWTGRYCERNINGCLSSPCVNNSQCIDLATDSDYRCVCPVGFTSKNCDRNINDCENISCNNGKCIDGINNFHCECNNSWFGEFCDTNRDLCSASPCFQSQLCKNVNTTQGFVCLCKPGFTGSNCNINIDDCVNQTCKNGGSCNDYINFANCTCAPGYMGSHCEIEINECESNPCLNNGTCLDFIGSFFCKCQPGFNGSICANNIDDCISRPCANNGSCIDEINDFSCNCSAGFIEKTCMTHKCDIKSTCVNNGTCLKTKQQPGYECQCLSGFTGKDCNSTVNQCASSPCLHNATCINKIASFECQCPFPFAGETCNDHICVHQPCQNNGTCIKLPHDYSCICTAGFTNRNCSTNINECSNNLCNSNNTAECIDLVNKYQCSCYEGFYGQFCNQTKCSIDNICNNGTCVMNNTSFYCNCYAGYAGEFCTENMNDCQNISCGTGVCIDEINGFSCQCPILKSGKYCEIDLDFCSSSPCLNNATCVNKPQNNTYQCICEPPFYGEHCDQHPCNQTDVCNNGTCISQQKNFSCQCFDGFSGKYCDHVIDLCRNVSCLNKGECVSSLNNFTCQCTQNFTGKYCETIIDYCHENKCSNVSNCVSNFVNRNYTCDCKPGYYGRFCEKNECQMLNPCRNGSTCFVSPTNGTICSCLPGFTSKYCSELIDNCESQPCLNNATCANGINSYKCQCKAGFTGNRCETFTGACSKRNCLNRGECIGNLTSSYCQCQHGFYGDLCERFSCPCQNNGRCFRFNSTSPIQCICSTNYTGSLCETFKGDCRSLNPPCTFESFCQLLPNGYACNCPQHLQGESCNVSGVCQDSTCKNNGICTSISTNRFSCSCKPGFTGSQCQFDMNECASNPCQNSGVCIEEGYGEAKCICLKSFHGNFCENAQESTVDTHSMMLHSTLGRSKKIMITSILQASPSQSLSMMTSYGAVTTPVTSYHLLSKSHKLQSTMMSFKYSTISTSHLTKSFYSSAQRFSTMTSIIIYTSSAEQIIAPTTSMQSIISSMHNTLKLVTPSTSSLSTVSRVSSTAATTIMTTTTRPYLNISCSDSPCNGFMCVNQSDNGLNFRCECLFPYYGPVCSNDTVLRIARFNGRSYVIFPQILLNQTVNTIVISFHTDQNNGLLFHASNDLRKDFITGKVKDRFFEVSMSFGSSEIITLKSGSEVATGNLVIASISINSNTRIVLLEVNRSDTVSKYISSTFQQIDLNNNWYFGGIPGYVKANFTGCIKDFQVNNKTIKLTDKSSVITWFGVSECDISACSRGACLNSAQCIPDHKNLDHFQCECKEGYFGKTCKDRNEYCKNTSCNGGSCVWTPSKSECLCQYGKTGVDCLNETLISMPRFSVVNNYSSYMEYPWLQTGRNAIDRFEIRFQFKMSSNSSNNDGLMVYMGQSTIGADTDDYLAIGIYQDYVILIYNLGSGTVVLQSRDKIPGNRTWHFLLIGRTLQQGYIYLNSQSKLSSRSPGIFTGLDVFTPLYVGGVPDFSNLPPVLKPYFNKGFSGVIYDTAIRTNSQSFVPLLTLKSSQASKNVIGIPVESGLNIVNDVKDYCASNPCANNGTCESSGWSFVCKCVAPYKPPNCHSTNALCVDYNPCSVKSSCRVDGFDVKCDCPFGYSGIFCTEKLSIEIPFFNMNSFISMIGVKVYSQAIISIQFKTTREYGLLFYTAHRLNEDSGDFFAISLWKRYIYVKFNLGSHTISMRTRNRVTLSKQHSLYVHQQGREAIMQLDDMTPPVGVAGSSTMTKLDVSQYFYVGGVPDMFLINKFATKDFVMQSGFSGCISQLTVNGKSFVLNSTNALLTGRNVQNCRALPCNECLNNAICHAQSSGTTNCTCALGFVGEYCEKDVLNMTSAYFNETSFWYTRREGLDSTSMGYSFDFKTSTISDSPQMIFWHGAIGDANDFLTVGIENGFLNITFAVKGVTSSKLSTTKYNDEKFHKLQIQRVDTTLLIFVDASSPQFIEISSSNIQSKSYGYIYLGGFPEKTRQYSGNRYTSGFIGCISNVELTPTSNDKMIIINFAEKQMAKGYGLRLCN